MAKKSKRTKRSKSKMKRGFETKNQSDRLNKKKFKRYKKKTKRKIRKRLTGGARFEGDQQFKSSLEKNRSITVSSEPIVVSPQNILDIVYNGLGLPSVIYDLLVILYFCEMGNVVDFDVRGLLNFNPISKLATPQSKGGKTSLWGMYDLDSVCKLINEKF